ncbi:MAG: ABC transporter ATP-binding protein [Pseudoramibacter sp.]
MKKIKMNSQSKKTLKEVLGYVLNYKGLLVLSLVTAALSVVLQLYVPILFGRMIDGIAGKGRVQFTLIGKIGIRIAAAIVIASVSTWIMNLVNNRLSYWVVRDIRAQVIRKIQNLSLAYLDNHPSGDIVSRVITDVDQLSDGLLLGLTQLFSGIVMIGVTIGFMLSINIPITAFVVAMTPVSFLVAHFIASRSFTMFRNVSDTRGRQTALIEELIGGEKVVKAFGYEDRGSKRFAEINREMQKFSQKAVFYSSLTNPSTRFVNSVIYAIVALIGALIVPHGVLTIGGLTALLAYANQYMKPFNDISSVITEFQNALACADRVLELLHTPSQAPDPDRALPAVEGNVDIDHLYFSYDPSKKLIQDFSLHGKSGMHIAIVGPTGCGKTTLINLLMRFYEADSGSIAIDGCDIYEVSRPSLRKNIGMVLQDTWLKHGTVRDNIAFGRPDASDDEIWQVAKAAHCDTFIRQMSQGLDTVIDDSDLSQGQKQLLCIARVMLIDPPMLILDEATSNIDTRTELQVQAAFDQIMAGKTSFVVAHRLSTVRNADLILVMRDGQIVEQGTHRDLLKQNGFYAKLYNSQFVLTNQVNHARSGQAAQN